MKNFFRNITIFIIAIVSLTLHSSKGQEKQNIGPVFHIALERLADNSGFVIDSLQVKWYKPYFISRTKGEGFVTLKPEQNGKIKFKLPYEDKPYAFQMYLYKNGNYETLLTNYFLAEAGDNIDMKIASSAGNHPNYSIRFDGSGAEKYNLAINLFKMQIEQGKLRTEIMRRPESLKVNLDRVNQLTLEYQNKGAALVKRSKLSSDMKKLVIYENYLLALGWHSNLYEKFKKSKDVQTRSIIRDANNAYKNKIYYPVNSVTSLSPSSLEWLGWGESLDLSINSTTDTVHLTDIYQRLKTKYSGKVKDILLANFFSAATGFTEEVMNAYNQVIFDSLAREAIEMVKLPSAKKRLIEQLRLSRGTKVPEVSFTDLKGNDVSLASLKGKVVMLDFWATGCSACARFHQWFHKEMYPMYKENKDFVYLSVNGDRTNERWNAALKTGRYSSDDYVNLNMGSRGLAHPFAQYYNMAAFPFLMVIGKDGNVYSENVPQNKDMARRILDGALMEKSNVNHVNLN